jgi:tetratricopeptide (TPR) repeat protein
MKAQNAGVIKQAILAPKVKGAFEKAVALNPKLVDAHVGLAQYYWRAPGIMGGDMEKAYKEAEIAIQLDEWKGRPLKANILISDKKNVEAIQEMTTFTGNNARDWRVWRLAGGFYLRNQLPDQAISAYQKYTSLRPDTAESHGLLARAYLQKKDLENSAGAAKKSLSLNSNYGVALETLARVCEYKGLKKEAVEYYQRLSSTTSNADRREEYQKKIKELQ